jgi:hypothetical protein
MINYTSFIIFKISCTVTFQLKIKIIISLQAHLLVLYPVLQKHLAHPWNPEIP